MGYSYGTYHFFGVHVPQDRYQTDHQSRETDFLDGMIKHTPGLSGTGVGHITGGEYDRYELFLCVVPQGQSCEVKRGSFATVTREAWSPEWIRLLKQLAEAAGYEGLAEPGWIVLPYCA